MFSSVGKKNKKMCVRVDISIKRDYDYRDSASDYLAVLRRIKYVIDKVEKKCPVTYRFFTFQYSPDVFIRFGTDNPDLVKRTVLDEIDSCVFKSFKVHILPEEGTEEHDLAHRIFDLFTTFCFKRHLNRKFKKYENFNEEKVFHILMNQMFVTWGKEVNFYMHQVKRMTDLYHSRSRDWINHRW